MTDLNVSIEIDVVKKVSDSGKAMLVTLTETGRDVWIPLSVIDYDECSITDEGDSGELVVRRWFADKEGLIS